MMMTPNGVDPQSATWPIVLAFAVEMEKKLAKNRHKGDREGWLRDDPAALFSRVVDEADELKDALIEGLLPVEVIEEAADVANMAMMTADRYAYQWSQRGLLERRAAGQQAREDGDGE